MPSSRLLCSLLPVLLTFALPAWGQQSLQVVGWSSDEQRLVVRLYELEEVDPSMGDDEESLCPGYVNHEGNKFRGSLQLVVYEKGKRLAAYPIQDLEPCTPPKQARARLDKAKQELAKLGIDLKQKQPGTALATDKDGKITVTQGPGAPYTLEAEEQVTESVEARPKGMTLDDDEFELHALRQVKGALVLFVRQGSERRQLLSQKVEGSYTRMMAGRHSARLAQVWLSPSGKTLAVISETSSGNVRSTTQSVALMGVLSWSGAPLSLR
jgi:hypothetical protein